MKKLTFLHVFLISHITHRRPLSNEIPEQCLMNFNNTSLPGPECGGGPLCH